MIEAIITDITTLGQPRVCIGALANGRQVRLSNPTPTDDWVAKLGGLTLGSVIEVDWTPASSPEPPHVEDGQWDPRTCRKLDQLGEAELIDILEPTAYSSIREAYGEAAIVGKQGSCAFPPKVGSRTLLTLRASAVSVSLPFPFNKVRVRFTDTDQQWMYVPLQDLIVNTHLTTCRQCDKRGEDLVKKEFEGSPALLRLGLARAMALGAYPSACWLQVNHVLCPTGRRHFV